MLMYRCHGPLRMYTCPWPLLLLMLLLLLLLRLLRLRQLLLLPLLLLVPLLLMPLLLQLPASPLLAAIASSATALGMPSHHGTDGQE